MSLTLQYWTNAFHKYFQASPSSPCITLYYLAHSLCILYIDLKLAATSGTSPSTNYMYLKYRPHEQSSEHLCSIILQWALLCVPIRQYRSRNSLLLILCRVCLVPPLYPLLKITLFLNCHITEPHGLQVPLCMVFDYFLILQSWHNIALTLPCDIVPTLPISILL